MMKKHTGIHRFTDETLREAEQAADIGGRLDAGDSERTWETIYGLTRKPEFDAGDEEFLRFHLSHDRELYLERLFYGTIGYVEFLRVWLVDKAKEECAERYTRQYHRRETNAAYCGLALFICFVVGIFGAGALVSKIFL